jgi:hypothetical protein
MEGFKSRATTYSKCAPYPDLTPKQVTEVTSSKRPFKRTRVSDILLREQHAVLRPHCMRSRLTACILRNIRCPSTLRKGL